MVKWAVRLLFAVSLIVGVGSTSSAEARQAVYSGYGNPAGGLCILQGMDAARDCAVDACLKEHGNPTQCAHIRSCSTAGWSMIVTVTHSSSHYWDEFHCGYSSQAAALRMLPLFCRVSRMLKDCRLTQLVDPEGVEIPIK